MMRSDPGAKPLGLTLGTSVYSSGEYGVRRYGVMLAPLGSWTPESPRPSPTNIAAENQKGSSESPNGPRRNTPGLRPPATFLIR
jgi:hypothetical protein